MGFWEGRTMKARIIAAIIKLPILFYLIFYLGLNWIQLLLIGIPIVLIIDIAVIKVLR